MMRAVLLRSPGPAANLELVSHPIPVPATGQVLIRVKAFGLNHSEILTRRYGRAPVGPVQLPRVLGIEAVGIVEHAPGHEGDLPNGTPVMTAIGGLGVLYDGSYAQYTCANKANVIPFHNTHGLGWDVLAALPEMLQTAHGSLRRCLNLQSGDTLLIRGGTTSVGLAAAAIARNLGAKVLSTTRKTDESTRQIMKEHGVSHVIVDQGSPLQSAVKEIAPRGVDKVLELVGASSLVDSMSCLKEGGTCCMTGLVGGSHIVPDFNPLAMIPQGRYLTAYGERSFNDTNAPFQDLIEQVAKGILPIKIGKTFRIDQIVQAHECIERNEANGKVVVLVD